MSSMRLTGSLKICKNLRFQIGSDWFRLVQIGSDWFRWFQIDSSDFRLALDFFLIRFRLLSEKNRKNFRFQIGSYWSILYSE